MLANTFLEKMWKGNIQLELSNSNLFRTISLTWSKMTNLIPLWRVRVPCKFHTELYRKMMTLNFWRRIMLLRKTLGPEKEQLRPISSKRCPCLIWKSRIQVLPSQREEEVVLSQGLPIQFLVQFQVQQRSMTPDSDCKQDWVMIAQCLLLQVTDTVSKAHWVLNLMYCSTRQTLINSNRNSDNLKKLKWLFLSNKR